MAGLLALILCSLAAWLVHALLGERLSFGADFVATTLVSAVVYVAAVYWLKKLRGGF